MISTYLFEFFHELRDPAARADPKRVQDHFNWYLDLWTRAETDGFDGIMFSEHHFGAGYAPSPNLLIAAMAPRTSTIRLGLVGSVTPYSTPWRMVEEFAMLDHLTGGRFEPGFVSGIPPELMAAGLGLGEAAERHAEILDVLDKAIALGSEGAAMSHTGKHWNFSNLRLVPPFLQQDIAVWTAAKSNESAAKAGRRGWKLCGGFISTADMATMFDGFRAAASDAGRSSGPDRLAIRRMVTFVESTADHDSGVLAGKRYLLDVLNESIGPLPPFAALLDRPETDSSGLSNDEFVSGTPSEVAEQLVEQCRAVGASNVMVMYGPTDPTEIAQDHALFAKHVLPVLHQASL